MTSILAGLPVHQSLFKQLDTSKLKAIHISEAPEEMFQRVIKAQEKALEMRYTEHPDTSNNPAYQNYAKVIVNGKEVASIDNQGLVGSSNAMAAKIQRAIKEADEEVGAVQGPALAQKRAEKIAEALGGEVVKSATALTQAQFAATPKIQATVDYDAMRQDPLFEQLQKTKQARTEFLAQQIGQETQNSQTQSLQAQSAAGHPQIQAASFAQEQQMFGTQSAAGQVEAEEAQINSAAEDFLEYMDKTAEERYFEAFLKEIGMTKEEYDALPPEEKQKITERFEEYVKQKVENAEREKQLKKQEDGA